MALSSPAERKVLHRRTIEVFGYVRYDQLWDIEAHLVDAKTNTYTNPWGGQVLPGEPVHDMSLRLTLDSSFKICAIDVASDKNPYPVCSKATAAFAQLVGLAIGPGWKKKVKERVGQSASCIHLAELLGPIGTVTFQTILPFLYDKGTFDEAPRPGLIDSCYAYRRGGDVVRRLWPNLPT
ncbi:hypothetical protein GGD67_002810 [Bradyrhizobium sp. IAR9]|uniref:DUF2889 domain-containing protein n=1 Tax=Bradyrhizobium sp. IAR9 TaxID=2663841 RepID=UPI0015CB4E99|nr:DUF2889 domain-containing protein [Bradyrhizobium sp. IAR9]NYG45352.1 hypothetical protein [Bradyrhizobium sp. IAR9]